MAPIRRSCPWAFLGVAFCREVIALGGIGTGKTFEQRPGEKKFGQKNGRAIFFCVATLNFSQRLNKTLFIDTFFFLSFCSRPNVR
jgi:hypothetical protein